MLHSSLRNIRHFNSRPHKKVDRNRKSGSSVGIIFQLTISRGCRLSKRILCVHNCIFQLTTSRGGRRKPFLFKQEEKPFQLTTSRGGRLLSCQALRCHWYFNSRPRKEVDEHLKRLNPSWIIFQLTTSQGGRH